jgi:hypothetical protein
VCEGARVAPRSKQPRRSQQSRRGVGRRAGAHRRDKGAPTRKLPRSADRECRAPMVAIRGELLVQTQAPTAVAYNLSSKLAPTS